MADHKSEGGGSPSLNLNTLLALLTLGGSVWFVSQRLTSDRPVTPAGGSRPFVGEQTLEARLWEDPFKSADRDGDLGRAPIATNFNPLIEQLRERSLSPEHVLLLPVMLSGGQYSEDQESRIRSRFAIVSALGVSGYAPEDAEHLGAMTIPWPTQHEVNQARTRTNDMLSRLWGRYSSTDTNASPTCTNCLSPLGLNTSFQMEVHYEWYRRRTFIPHPHNTRVAPHVLVLWLDDSFFEDEPLLRLPLLFEPLVTNGLTEVSLIGPRRSSTLRAMLPGHLAGTTTLRETNSNLWDRATNVLRHVTVYCATPSAMDEVLVTNDNAMPRKLVGDRLVANGFKAFHNLLATDAQIAEEMLDELRLRRVDLRKTNEHHLVLISEWDTFYARMLSLTYGAEMALRQGAATSRADFVYSYISKTSRAKTLPANFHPFVYLRGLDGQTVGGKPDARTDRDSSAKSPTISFEELREWAPDANKAEGQAQFDYLGRLGDQLDELEARLRRENRRLKIAVGIVGSDVYDTLLILQALRARFPNFLFFTTDLDARFWHPRERAWSRNLIVASAYGLTLHPDLQGAVAPFRDSTQTAQFAAALAALGNTNLASLTNVPPRRFEIGTHGAVDLSVEPGFLMAPHFLADTNRGPWIHPLTAHEAYVVDHQVHTEEMSLTRAGELFRSLLRLKGESDLVTRYDSRIMGLFGLGFILVLACMFWQPLRARTVAVFGFLVEALTYHRCDVGGPEGVAALLARISDRSEKSDPASAWLAEQWRKQRSANCTTAPNAGGSSPGGMTQPVLNDKDRDGQFLRNTTQAGETHEARGESVKTPQQQELEQTRAFVGFLNRLLHGTLHLPIELRTIPPDRRDGVSGTLPGPPLFKFLDRLSDVCLDNLSRVVSRWKPGWMLRRRENRRFLDALLDQLTPGAAGHNQLSVPGSARAAAWKLSHFRLLNLVSFWAWAIVVVGLSTKLGLDIWNDAYKQPAGEPFSLTNGISGWPAIIFRSGAFLLSMFFSFTLYSQLRVMFFDLTRSYRFPLNRATPWRYPWRRAVHFFRRLPDHCFPFRDDEAQPSGRVCASTLWRRYEEGGHWIGRVARAGIACVIYFYLARVIYQLFGSPFQPLRGETIRHWTMLKISSDWTVMWNSIVNISFFFLTFLAIDAARLCRRFIQKLSAGNVEFPNATRAHFRRQRGDVAGEYLDDWIGTRLIADLTDRVGKLLWFPAMVLLLLLMARLDVWDHWPWHTAHIILMTLNFGIALASVLILQHAARDAKRAAEERLTAKVNRLRAQTAPSPEHNDAAQAERLLEEIRNIHHGAFGPIRDNPVLGALLVGPGGLTVLQMLIWFMSR